jgi:hypothetical protein
MFIDRKVISTVGDPQLLLDSPDKATGHSFFFLLVTRRLNLSVKAVKKGQRSQFGGNNSNAKANAKVEAAKVFKHSD